MIDVAVCGLTKAFGQTNALSAVSLDFAAGSFTALLGPSGCGKTTLLRLLAGFEAPDGGEVRFGAEIVADARRQRPAEERGVGVVFQSYALWPHMSVGENIAYPLKMRRIEKAERGRRVSAVLETVGLSGLAERGIEALSGGQRQRVALARCLVADAKVILFDEPLANLDMHLRASMIETFRDIRDRTRATMVYVTHDQSEALALADRVVVMQAGRVLQADAPTMVYRSPASDTVAGFVGRGSRIAGRVIGPGRETVRVVIGNHEFAARHARSAVAAPGPVRILLRPEALTLAHAGLAATVIGSIYRGAVYEVSLNTQAGDRLTLDCAKAPPVGAQVHVAVSDAWVIPE